MKTHSDVKLNEPGNECLLQGELFASRPTSLKTLPDEQKEIVQQKLFFIQSMRRRGETPEQFLKYLRDNESARIVLGYTTIESLPHRATVYEWIKHEKDPYVLADKRLLSRPDSKVPDWQLMILVLELVNSSKRSTKKIVRSIARIAKKLGWREAKYDAIHRLRKRITQQGTPLDLIKKLREGQFYLKYGMVIFRVYYHSNERWEIDWCHLDIWVIGPDGELVKPIVLLAIDCASRLVMGWRIMPSVPNKRDYIKFLKFSFLPKGNKIIWQGIPEIIQTDNAEIFKCGDVQVLADVLGFELDPITPHCPSEDGVVERAIQTLKRSIMEQFVGSLTKATLPTSELQYVGSWDDLEDALAQWVFFDARLKVHPAIGMTPYQFWIENLESPERGIADAKRVREACLVSKKVKVCREGVQVAGSFYTSERLAGYIKRHVTVYHNPESEIYKVEAVLNGESVDLTLNTAADHRLQRALKNSNASTVSAAREANKTLKQMRSDVLPIIAPGSAKAQKEFKKVKASKKSSAKPKGKEETFTIISSVPVAERFTFNAA